MQKESASKQGRKFDKAEPTVHKDPAFDELDDDEIDYIETEDVQDVGRTRYVVHEEKESAEKEVSTEDALSTAQPKVSTNKAEVSTERPDKDTNKQKVSTDKKEVSTDRPDEVLIIMSQNKEKLKEKEKGVELKDVEETERPRPTSTRSLLTLKPFPKIDPKDKGKKKIEEEDEYDTESKGITKAEKKFKQLAKDEEVARKVQEDWEAEEEARLNADKILAEKIQEEEREMYSIEQRAKLLHDTIAAQRIFLAQQRSKAIRNKPPSRNQLRNQMMTYLKHNFVAIGSAEDKRQIKELNKEPEKKKLKKRVVNEEDTTKVPTEQEVTKQGTKKRKSVHVKMIDRKRPRRQPDNDSDDEYRKCLRIITFKSTIDSEIMETKSFIARVHKVSSPDGNYLVVYIVYRALRAFNYRMENNQQEWEIVRWRLYEACGVCILEFKDGTVIYMLVERRYPLSKELLQQMLDLGLEVEEESTVALQLGNNSLVVYNKELAIPEQTATGKGIPNPLMAGSLPKTIKPTSLDVVVLLKR
ncbi:hypothetical protein Tco_0764758 [Tanacetum coccineum]